MSSLVDSIFGVDNTSAEAKEGAATVVSSSSSSLQLFATKIDVPEPRDYPVAFQTKRHSAAGSTAEKKQRKPKKTAEDLAQAAIPIGPQLNPDAPALQQDSHNTELDDVDERTVFVGNLPLHMTRKALHRLFTDCGRIASTRIRSVAAAGVKLPPSQAGNQNLVRKVCSNTQQLDATVKHCVLGYVVFHERESVEAAVAKNNMAVPESDVVRNAVFHRGIELLRVAAHLSDQVLVAGLRGR